MSNYPPGVTGREPEITGDWPCPVCGSRTAFCLCAPCPGCGNKPVECSCPDNLDDQTVGMFDTSMGCVRGGMDNAT